MPFNFDNGNTPRNKIKSNTDYTSSSLDSIPRPNSGEGSSFTPSSSGFSSPPTKKSHENDDSFKYSKSYPEDNNRMKPSSRYSQKVGYEPRKKAVRRPTTRRSNYMADISWRNILIIVGVILAIVICWIFRDEITSFLAQLFAWIIIILVIVFLIKWFIFPKKK